MVFLQTSRIVLRNRCPQRDAGSPFFCGTWDYDGASGAPLGLRTDGKISHLERQSQLLQLMKPIVLFGTGKIAEVILYFFSQHSNRQVVACSVDRDFLPGTEWQGIPTVPFDEIRRTHPPESHDMFVALGYQEMNALRTRKCAQIRALGYTLASCISPDSGLPNDAVFGDNCFIMNQVNIHPRVQLGNNVFVWSGAMIGHHASIGDNCWLTSGANIAGVVTMGRNCFMAVNATVTHGISVADDCFIGANALVTKSTQPGEVYVVENTKPFRLNSSQFLRMSRFSEL